MVQSQLRKTCHPLGSLLSSSYMQWNSQLANFVHQHNGSYEQSFSTCLCLQALRARNAPLTKGPGCGEYCVGVKPCRLKAIATPTNLQTCLTAAYLTAARYLLHMVVLTLLSTVEGSRSTRPACICEVLLWCIFN